MKEGVGLARDAAANALVRPEKRGGSVSLLQQGASDPHAGTLQGVGVVMLKQQNDCFGQTQIN